MKLKRFLGLALLLLAAFGARTPVRAQEDAPLVMEMTLDAPIAPAAQQYLHRALQIAERRDAELLVLRLNTPGGSISAMTDMVQELRASRVPVVVYISPRGAMAASAGSILTLAGHAAAMAPETIIGAASPVGGQGEDLGDTLKAKETEALKATVRTLAARRGEDAVALAEEMVENARALSAAEALDAGIVDFIAEDTDDLLRQLDGFTVLMPGGETRTLHTQNAAQEEIPISFIEALLQMLTDPNIVFLLLTIGVQALFIELSHPGGWVAGFIGVVSLALATYGLGILPVNWFGLIFLLLAFGLFVLDLKAPTHGALTTAGIASFVLGALVLFNSPGTPQFERVSVPLVVIVAILTGLMFAVILAYAIRALHAPIRTGEESLLGSKGIAKTDIAPSGMAYAAGELWSAELADGAEPIQKGERILVVDVEGIHLKVKKAPPRDDAA